MVALGSLGTTGGVLLGMKLLGGGPQAFGALHHAIVAMFADWLEQQILHRRTRRSRVAFILGKWMVRGSWSAIAAQLQGRGG